MILHAGDIGSPGILSALRAIAPVYAVRGNNDGAWADALPPWLQVNLGGMPLCMAHRRADIPQGAGGIAVFGHSHQCYEQEIAGRLWLNPGSCGPHRFGREAAMALIWVKQDGCRVKKIIIQPANAGQ